MKQIAIHERPRRETREFEGVWQIEGGGKGQDEVVGSVRIESGKPTLLRLHGGFNTIEGDQLRLVGLDHSSTITGVIEGGLHVTLLSALKIGEETLGAKYLSQRWQCLDAFISSKPPPAADALYSTVAIETLRTDEWIPQPSYASHRDGRTRHISSTLPPAEEFRLPGGVIVSIGWLEVAISMDVGGRSAETCALITVNLPKPLPRQTLWDQYVTPMLLLMTLATGEHDRLKSVHLGHEEDPSRPSPQSWTSAEWISPSWRAEEVATRPTHPYPAYHTLPYEMFRTRLGDLFEKWFELFEAARYPLLEHLHPDFDKGSATLEDEFTRSVRCLEVYHRKTQGGTYFSRDQFASLMDRLIGATADQAEREYVMARLSYGNETTLKKRIDWMIDRSCRTVRLEADNKQRFARKVVDTRNALTHESDISAPLLGPQMMEARDFLWRIMNSNVLRDLGLSDSEVDEALQRSRFYRFGGVNYLGS